VTATARSADRRRAILDAALSVFTERGYDAATIEDVRERSGASIGSIYHHYGSKEQLAAALYAEGLADYQRGFAAVLARDPQPAAGIRALVRHHLRWVEADQRLARFLLEHRTLELREASAPQIEQQNAELVEALDGWLAPHLRARVVHRLPPDLFLAVLLGPSQEFARAWLRGNASSTIEQAVRALSAAATAALTTQ
jgi:AcrR family transcriptional regulator